MKYTYFVIDQQDIETGKYISRAEKVPNCNNLYGYFVPYKGYKIISITAIDTWKKAQETARIWNDGHKRNKRYALA